MSFVDYKQQACAPASGVRGSTNPHALLLVSRQIYKEAREIPYYSTTFRYDRYQPKLNTCSPKLTAMHWIRHLQLSVTLRFCFQDCCRSRDPGDLAVPTWISFGASGRSFLDSFPGLKRLYLSVDLVYPPLDYRRSEHQERAQELKERVKAKISMPPCLAEFIAAIETRQKDLEVYMSNNSCGVYFEPLPYTCTFDQIPNQ